MVGIEKGIAQQFRVNTFNLIAERSQQQPNQITTVHPQAVISVY